MRRFVSILFVVGAMSSVLSEAPASASAVVLRPPTDAPIVDVFSLPQGQFGPGNRGITYDTAQGEPIVAAGPGVVVFAGAVAGSLHATIDHGGGLLTSYSFVERLLVRQGDRVAAGEKIALSGDGFHFGMRVDGRYVDPETMFGIREVEVSLVPSPRPGERQAWLDISARSERIEFLDMGNRRTGGVLGFIGGLIQAAGSATFTPLRWLDPEARLMEVVDTALMLAVLADEIRIETLVLRSSLIAWEALRPRECTEAGAKVGPPLERRIAIVVDGLNSSSDSEGAMSKLDLESHGYDRADIIRFSYSGGRVADGSAAEAAGGLGLIQSTTYDANDTRGSVAGNVDDLEAMLRDASAAFPGVPIDVYGHSLGGLITRLAVVGVADDVDVGVVVTLGAPNHGVPLSEILQASKLVTPIAVIASAAEVVAPNSVLAADVIDDLSPSGYAGRRSEIPFPDGVHAVSIGASGDLVVPGSVTDANGAENVLIDVPFGLEVHSDLPGMDEVDREVSLALADLPAACRARWDRLAAGAKALAVEEFERSGAALVAVGAIVTTGG